MMETREGGAVEGGKAGKKGAEEGERVERERNGGRKEKMKKSG